MQAANSGSAGWGGGAGWRLRGLGLCLAACVAMPAQALSLPKDERELACWLKHTRERTKPVTQSLTSVDFSNLRDGYVLRSPFLVTFAVRGMGVVPAGLPLANTGHHHLLIDTRLPMSLTDGLPFSNTHRHYGKGQTQTVVELPSGAHSLRLLFADHLHKPYFVFSPEIRVTVAAKRTSEPVRIDPAALESSCAAWYEEEQSKPRPPGEWLSFANLRDGEPVVSPFSLHLAVEGYGVCAVGQSAERSGHFLLEVFKGEGKPVQVVDLSNGATQATLNLPPASYRLRLRFVDGKSGRDLLPTFEQNLPVVAQERL